MSENLRSNLLAFYTFSNFWDDPSSIFQRRHFFPSEIKKIPIQILFTIFSKFHEFGFFFKIAILFLKLRFPQYISYKKGYIGHIFWDRPRFPTITVRYDFFSHKYTRNNMIITNAKKNHIADFSNRNRLGPP